MHVTHAVTQGHVDRFEWVTKYQVSYRLTFEEDYQWVRDDLGEIIVSTNFISYILVLYMYMYVTKIKFSSHWNGGFSCAQLNTYRKYNQYFLILGSLL